MHLSWKNSFFVFSQYLSCKQNNKTASLKKVIFLQVEFFMVKIAVDSPLHRKDNDRVLSDTGKSVIPQCFVNGSPNYYRRNHLPEIDGTQGGRVGQGIRPATRCSPLSLPPSKKITTSKREANVAGSRILIDAV